MPLGSGNCPLMLKLHEEYGGLDATLQVLAKPNWDEKWASELLEN